MENKKTILFTEDNYLVLHMMKTIYPEKFKNYNIEIYEDGKSLVKRLEEENTENIHVIVTDDQMPGINGSEIIKKYSDRFKFILNYGGDKNIGIHAIKNGAVNYMMKPVEIPRLIEIIEGIK